MARLEPDGSAQADAVARVEIDRDKWPYRWTCPQGHTTWEPTNSHIWCPSCRRARENGADIDAEHWELVDQRTEETVPYSAIILSGD